MRSSVPFRIQIGVTGHREVPDEKKLSEKINQVFKKDLLELFDEDSKKIIPSPHTPIAFSVLTPLAEGADRLVAKAVLDFTNARIEVVLPLAKEDYLQDFKSPESRQEFEELLSQARRPITLKERRLQEEFPDDGLAEARRQAYEDVGRYIVDHCDVLIALWDGKPSRGKGGTTEIIEYAMKKERPLIIISTIPPYETSVEKGNGINAKSLSEIEFFNAFHISESEQKAYSDNMYGRMFNNKEGEKLPEEVRTLVRDKLLPFYARASVIAKENQKLYRHVGFIVYSFSALAIASVAIGALIYWLSPYAFFIEFLFLATILFLVIFANRRRTHKKWIENRFLAERIRSAVFFTVCGVEASLIEVPPYLRVAHRPDDWTIKVFYEIWNSLPRMKGCQKEYCQQCKEFIQKHWIQDQKKFHGEKTYKSKKISRILEWSGMVIFLIALFVAITHCVFFSDHELHLGLSNLLIFFAIVLPAVGAAIGGIRSHWEYSRLEKRSRNMETALTDIDDRFSYVNTPEALESLLREAEELMLRETQDWLMLMRFAELKPVA